MIEAEPLSPLCPVRWFLLHLRVRRSLTHLFHSTKGFPTPLTHKYPMEVVRRCLRLIGVDPTPYGSHSLRRGGATAASALVRTHVLKRHGNWLSSAVYVYIHDGADTRLSVGQSLLSLLR